MPSEGDFFADNIGLVYLGNQCSFHLIRVNMVSVFCLFVYLICFQCIIFNITELIPFSAVLPSYY